MHSTNLLKNVVLNDWSHVFPELKSTLGWPSLASRRLYIRSYAYAAGLSEASLPFPLTSSRKLTESVAPTEMSFHSSALLSGHCIIRAHLNWLLSATGTAFLRSWHPYRATTGSSAACVPSSHLNDEFFLSPHCFSCVCVSRLSVLYMRLCLYSC